MATQTMASRPPLPPFTHESAIQKVRLAEDGWNTRDPAKVALAYAMDSSMEESLRVRQRTTRHHCFPHSQVGQRVGLQAYQGAVGIHRESRRRPLRLRVAR